MDPITALAFANGLVTLLEVLVPKIEAAAKKGEITPEAQAALKTRIDKLRSGEAFTGPEWDVTP